MNKLPKTGLNAMVAMALMFVTSVGVAQEKVMVSDDVEVTGSVETKVLTGAVEKLQLHTWTFDGGPTDSETIASNYSLGGSPSCSLGEETVCQIQAPEDLSLPPGSPRQPDMSALVGTTNQTVAQRIASALLAEDTNETAISLKDN